MLRLPLIVTSVVPCLPIKMRDSASLLSEIDRAFRLSSSRLPSIHPGGGAFLLWSVGVVPFLLCVPESRLAPVS